MLRSFRSAARSWLAKLLFALLIASFAVWGVGDMVGRAGPGDELAEVGGVVVTREAVDTEFRRMVDRLRPMMGGAFTNEQAIQLGFVDQAAQTLAQRALLRLAAEDAGIMVSDQMVRNQIGADRGFQNQAGQFDGALFLETLRRNNLSEAGYVAMLRDDMARELLTAPVAAGAFAPKMLVEALFAHRGERRTAEVLTLPHAAVTDIPAADDGALQTYHAEHPIAFTAPEYRGLTVLQLLLDDLAKEVQVTDADLAEAYEMRRAEFETPERRTVRMIVVDDAAKAAELATRATAEGLDAAAKAAGADVVDLGEVTEDDLPGFGEAVFAAPKGVSPQPLQSPLGLHVVEVTSITPGSVRTLEQVREGLIRETARERAADGVFQVSNRLDDQLAAGASPEDAAKALGLRLTKIDAVDATGKGRDGLPAAAALPDSARVLQTAFTLAPGAVSGLTETQAGDFFVVRVDNIVAPVLRPFAEVRDQVAAAWSAEQRAGKAAEKIKELEAKLRDAPADAGAEIAKAFGAQYALTTPFARDQTTAGGLPPFVVAQLFTRKPGETATGEGDDAHVAARLKEIIPADPARQAEELAALQASTAQALERDLLSQFIDALQREWPVTLHRDRISRLYSGG